MWLLQNSWCSNNIWKNFVSGAGTPQVTLAYFHYRYGMGWIGGGNGMEWGVDELGWDAMEGGAVGW